eukprot:NODE_911_length_2702_cov_2.945243.p1 GENE.NODE_911_length_2702_cov_2.945243~~NODE_911_length_2702_cov_2.945243.p1  ORF type:complete len:276 (-),score=65.23 NODE_911_length_2702_cov_2.945243:1859-2686(-)
MVIFIVLMLRERSECKPLYSSAASAMYKRQERGCQKPGFIESFLYFSRWQLPSANFLNPTADAPAHAFVGFEYLCCQGHRFFVPPSKNSGLMQNSVVAARASRRDRRRRERTRDGSHGPPLCELPGLLEEGGYEVAPLCAHRIYVPCTKHTRKDGSVPRRTADAPCVGQLVRLWLQTPPASRSGELIEAAPRVSIPDTRRGKTPEGRTCEVICTGGRTSLPHSSLVQLAMPATYFAPAADGGDTLLPLPGFGELEAKDAERCRLLPYTFWVSKPS